jgi:transposase
VHVAAACDQLGSVLGTQAFPTTAAGYHQLLRWLRGFGDLTAGGIEGTGSYGVGLTRFLLEAGVELREVLRPNRQVRRRNSKTDVVDAIAAARAVLSGEASGRPKSHGGAVEALRALKIVHRSANKSRTQALNQMRDLITKLALRTLARRIAELDEELAMLDARRRRVTHPAAPKLVAAHGIGPDTATGLLLAAGDNPDRLGSERSWSALLAAHPIEHHRERQPDTDSVAAPFVVGGKICPKSLDLGTSLGVTNTS